MLISGTKKEIQEFVKSECKEFQEIRSIGLNLIKDIFRDIFRENKNELDSFGRDLEKLMAIGLELSESVFESVANGNLLSSCGTLRQQIVVSQLSFACSNNDDIYENWKSGKGIKESKLRTFLKEFESQEKVPKYDPDEESYKFYSELYHLKYDSLGGAYLFCTKESIDEFIKIDIRMLLIESLKYTFRILLVALGYSDRKSMIDSKLHRKLIERWNELDDRVFQLRNKIVKKREELLKIIDKSQEAKALGRE